MAKTIIINKVVEIIFAYNNFLLRSFSKRCRRCCRVSAICGCFWLTLSFCAVAGKWLCICAWNTGAGRLLAGGGCARTTPSLAKVEVVADCGVERSTLACCPIGGEEPVLKWNLVRSRFPSRLKVMSVKEKTHFRDNPLFSNINFGMGIVIGSNPSWLSSR